MQIIQLKLSKRAYMKAVNLVKYMEKYSASLSYEDKEMLDTLASLSDGMPLPSGRWGNAIALALEINDYVSAKYLIENAEKLNLETNRVVSEFGGKNPWGLKDEFLFSLLTFEPLDDDLINEMKKNCSDEQIQKAIEYDNRQLEAIGSLEKQLSITSEEKKMIRK